MTDQQQIKFGLNIPVSKIYTALKWVVLINIIFLFGTFVHHSRLITSSNKTLQIFLSELNFAKENVAAAWYSSMLFFISGMMALLCFWADTQRSGNAKGRILNFGWLVIAGIFVVLSFDEMGSFHETIGQSALFKSAGHGGKGGWLVFYGLVLLVAIFMITFFISKFKGNKLALFLTLIGVALFLSNPFQEKLEIHSWRSSPDPSTWRRPVFFLLLEEGSEIFASFCFLYSFTAYAIGAAPGNDAAGKTLRLESVLNKNFVFYLCGLAFLLGTTMLLIHINAWHFDNDDNGLPHNWPPAATAFLGFTAGLYLYFKFDEPQVKQCYLLVAFTGLLLSVYFGSNIYAFSGGLFGIFKYMVLALVLLTGVRAIIKLEGQYAKILMAGWILLMAASVFTKRFLPPAFGYLAAASLVIGLFLHYQYRSRKN